MAIFAEMQRDMAKKIHVKPGFFVHMIGSAHIYMEDLYAKKLNKTERKLGKNDAFYVA